MNRKFLSGLIGLTATVALAGVAGSIGEIDGDERSPTSSEKQSGNSSVDLSKPAPDQVDDKTKPAVPIRSGNPEAAQPATELQPVAIQVGGINLDASIIPVGVDTNNQLEVPSAELVGWYQYSPTPGSAGATVLAAHVDYGGKPGAFFDLHLMTVGDRFKVELEDATTQWFEVTGNTTYDKVDLPEKELFRKDGKPVLQLVTCGGTFDPTVQSYEANVVVSAVPL